MEPLAYRMRPQTIDDILGQQHLVGQNGIIRRMVEANRLSSMILYGPPGVGKTSIARAIAGSTNVKFRQLNAVTNTKKDMQIVAEEAKMSGQVILLLDEIHRLDKSKQDFLLPHLENGKIILIGATTSNPYHAINPAIRSRTQIFELHSLSEEDIETAIYRAIKDKEYGLGSMAIEIEKGAIQHFTQAAAGDVRTSLNALELAALSTKEEDGVIHITRTDAEDCLQKSSFHFDRDGDAHYDIISAFQKSIRGSDVDASLHYLARLIEGGDLPTIARRLLVISFEDIGLASPQAASRTLSAIEAAERLGFPEARIPLAQAVIELALSPKSNSTIQSIDSALSDIRKGHTGEVPNHLKDGHYAGAKQLGRAQNYVNPHNHSGYYVQQYLPDLLKNKKYYKTNELNPTEKKLKEIYKNINEQKKK